MAKRTRPAQDLKGSVQFVALNALRRLGSSRAGPAATRVTEFVLAGLRNYGADMDRNGERWLLRRLSALAPSVVLDVGANIGNWALMAQQEMPGATVHCFEPAPDTFTWLVDWVRDYDGDLSRIVYNNVALWDDSRDSVRLHLPTAHTEATAIAAAFPGTPSVEVPATTGDAYLRERGLDHVDLLKVDVEGAEPEVLSGFERSLSSGVVEVVQFEYTTWQGVPARRWLGDLVELLEPHGFRVGKLLSRRVDFHPYGYGDEQFPGGNYVAVRPGSAAADLLGCPAARPPD